MRLHEEFTVGQPAEEIWSFFDQPERVSRCMPGIEEVTVIDADTVDVRATQSIGPLSATFDAKVTVLERVPNELIRFQAVGKSVRGASGHLRSLNAVRLVPGDGATTVVVDGDVALAGALGSVGQKIVAKQAGKVTAEFARNLERSLNGEELPSPARRARTRPEEALRGDEGERVPAERDPFVRVAAVLSALSAVLSIIAILRSFRSGPPPARRGRFGSRGGRVGERTRRR